MERGVIINRTHDTVLRFLPPYVIGKAHVDEVMEKLEAVLQEQKGEIQTKAQVSAKAKVRRSVSS
jgi:acetylornithine/succinyldiaminopimelate/putrescine aminotransferase